MQQVTKLTVDEFSRIRPLNGYVVVKPEQDVTKIKLGDQYLWFDGSYSPENNQVVINRVVRVPEEDGIYSDFQSEMLLSEDALVWINYYSIIQAKRIDVEGQIYLIVSYRDCFMSAEEGDDGKPVYTMLNDWVRVGRVSRKIESDLAPEALRTRDSKRFFVVEQTPMYGTFQYTKGFYPPLKVEPGDLVVLRDPNVFKLEFAPHFVFDKKPHFVVRAEKILFTVDALPSSDEDLSIY